jgi:cytochrome b561
MAERAARYTAVAIVLHWAIAFAILLNFPLGLWMHEQAEDGAASQGLFALYQLHKSIGLTVLGLNLVRLAWRLTHRPPPVAEGVAGWERLVAKATHWAFYVLMVAVPLTGWIYVSAGWSVHEGAALPVATRWFGLIEVPHLFGLDAASAEVREETADSALDAHALLAFIMAGLAVLHVAAALKHQFLDRDATLAHMLPGLRTRGEGPAPKSAGRLAVLGVGLGATGVALAAAAFFIASNVGSGERAPASTFEVVENAGEAPAAPSPTETMPTEPAPPGAPAAWRVDQDASSIGFSYTYEDESGSTAFNGRFNRWGADIRFDQANLEQSSANVQIETGSAATGVAMHDNALPGAEWFDAGTHPRASFRTTRISAGGDGQYEARGELTIRGRTREVELPFTLRIEGDRAVMDGRTRIDRRDFDVGTDGAGDELISREIGITIHVEALRGN